MALADVFRAIADAHRRDLIRKLAAAGSELPLHALMQGMDICQRPILFDPFRQVTFDPPVDFEVRTSKQLVSASRIRHPALSCIIGNLFANAWAAASVRPDGRPEGTSSRYSSSDRFAWQFLARLFPSARKPCHVITDPPRSIWILPSKTWQVLVGCDSARVGHFHSGVPGFDSWIEHVDSWMDVGSWSGAACRTYPQACAALSIAFL